MGPPKFDVQYGDYHSLFYNRQKAGRPTRAPLRAANREHPFPQGFVDYWNLNHKNYINYAGVPGGRRERTSTPGPRPNSSLSWVAPKSDVGMLETMKNPLRKGLVTQGKTSGNLLTRPDSAPQTSNGAHNRKSSKELLPHFENSALIDTLVWFGPDRSRSAVALHEDEKARARQAREGSTIGKIPVVSYRAGGYKKRNFCSRCGGFLPDARYCPSCGVRTCEQCNDVLDKDTECLRCHPKRDHIRSAAHRADGAAVGEERRHTEHRSHKSKPKAPSRGRERLRDTRKSVPMETLKLDLTKLKPMRVVAR